MKRRGIATRKKKEGYELTAVDKSTLPSIDSKTIPLPIAFRQHYKKIVFDVTNMASYDVVLSMPWLAKHNLVID